MILLSKGGALMIHIAKVELGVASFVLRSNSFEMEYCWAFWDAWENLMLVDLICFEKVVLLGLLVGKNVQERVPLVLVRLQVVRKTWNLSRDVFWELQM